MTRLMTVIAASELLLGRVGPERIDVSWWKLAVMLWCCEGGGAVELDDAVDSAASDASETGGGLCGAGVGGVGTVDWEPQRTVATVLVSPSSGSTGSWRWRLVSVFDRCVVSIFLAMLTIPAYLRPSWLVLVPLLKLLQTKLTSASAAVMAQLLVQVWLMMLVWLLML